MRPEQGSEHDAKGQLPHLGGGVDHFAVAPARRVLGGVEDHGVAVGPDALTVEAGLDSPSLPEVKAALAGKQALAQRKFHPPAHAPQGQLLTVCHKDVFHVVGVGNQVEPEGPLEQEGHIRMPPGLPGDHHQGVA